MSSMEASVSDLGFNTHWIAKKGKKIQIFTVMLELDTGVLMDKSKTVGTIMSKNNSNVLMAAHSGYSTGPSRDEGCLDTAKWNGLALNHMSKQMNFKFPGNIRDNNGPILDEHRGRAHADHWYVVDVFKRHVGPFDISEKEAIKNMKKLKDVRLGDERCAFITIDSEPCLPCLQFLNMLWRHTGIMFVTSGSQGVGPVQVRIDGQRRCDMVGSTFYDSDDTEPPAYEALDGEVADVGLPDPAQPEEGSSTSTVARTDTATERRAGKQPVFPWHPEDPEELVSSYKRKTPVYEFPGYNTAPQGSRSHPTNEREQGEFIVIEDDEAVDDDDVVMIDGDRQVQNRAARHAEGLEWQDLEDDVKNERPQPLRKDSETLSMHSHTIDSISLAGSAYAQAAGEAVKSHEERKEALEKMKGLNTETGSEKQKSKTALNDFRHHTSTSDVTEESYFRRKYSILRPA
ncbi:hypothetical protein F5Y17DRAFT_459237 [Xylariaceae sp. FL0594]|nr:hypothetical protein F5Y17DRAFT_459237 [Xylariaceae sp. FL0594]